MNQLLTGLWILIALFAAAAVVFGLRAERDRRAQRRDRARSLRRALRVYLLWLENQRDPAVDRGQYPACEPLDRVRELALRDFPELSSAMVELRTLHEDIVGLRWQHRLAALKDTSTQGAVARSAELEEKCLAHRRSAQRLLDHCASILGNSRSDDEPPDRLGAARRTG